MLHIEKLTFSRAGRNLLENATLQIHPRQRVGLIGQNGTGKSSLLALLNGEFDADRGTISMPQNWLITTAKQETPALNISALDYVLDGHHEYRHAEQMLKNAKTADEIATAHELFERIHGYAQPARAAELLYGLGFNNLQQKQTVAEFSGGWRMRLNLAQALIAPADLLLLDEPSNHLDLDAVIWLQNYLKRLPCTQIIIAHDRELLDELCTHILHLENQRLTLYTGNYSAFERQYQERRAQEQAFFQAEAAKRAHLEDFVRRFRAKASKAKQAQSRLKALEKLTAAPPSVMQEHYSLNLLEPEHIPEQLLTALDVSLGYGETMVLQKVKFHLTAGTRLGLLGRNGAGKSTLMKFIAGQLKPISGIRNQHMHTKIAYFHQHQLDAFPDNSNALREWQKLNPQLREQEGRNFLGGFGFRGERLETNISRFSGGERARLALALLVVQRPNLLLLDEPTNHLDLTMRDELTLALQNYRGAIVLISHDRSLLRATCDEFLLVTGGKTVEFSGDLDDYQNLLLTPAEIKETRPPKINQKRLDAEKRERLRPLKQALSQAEKRLEILNKKMAQVQEKLAHKNLYADKDALKTALLEETNIKREIVAAEEVWLQIASDLEKQE